MKGDTRKPAKIGRYEVVDQLGAGGMGVVYLATDPLLRRTVAIKALPGHDEELRERFAREGRSAASLRHNNIVTIYDVGEDDGKPFLAMEFVDGESMAELIRRRAPLTLEQRLKMMLELCAGLGYAHRNGIVHRDIKPGNLMITAEGTLKILDFGLARITSEGRSTGLTQAGSILGTPHYMCPEQIEGRPVDPRSDIFSVGLVLYELLSYQRAYAGESTHVILHNIIHTKPRPIQELVPLIDHDLVRIVEKSIEKLPENRYQDLGTFAAELERIRARAGDMDGTTRIEPRPGPGRKPPSTSGDVAPAREGRTRANPELIAQRRATQVESHVKAAGEHMAAGRYEDAVAECENAMLLDPHDQRALSLFGQAQAALDDRQVREFLNEARARLAMGELTAAQALIDQTLMLHADLEEAQQLRREVRDQRAELERKVERTRAARVALERARRNLEEGAFEAASRSAAEVLAYDATNEGALEVRRRAVEAIEVRRRQHELDMRAADVVEQARLRAAAGSPRSALTLLEAFAPPHTLVTGAIARVRAEIAALEQRQREDAERQRQRAIEEQRRRDKVASLKKEAADALQARRFADALSAVELATRELPDDLELQELDALIRAAEEEAVVAARKRQAIDQHLRDCRAELKQGDLQAASQAVQSALTLAPGEPEALKLQEEIRHAEKEREAAAAIAQAETFAEAGSFTAALDFLASFSHQSLVASAIEGLRARQARLEEEMAAEARRVAEAKARHEAEEKARREAEEKARREAEQKARREAEQKARREADEKARREADEKARREAEEKARREAEQKARREADEKARREAEEKARREAEEKARREAEQKARREADEKARREAEEKAHREAEEKARREAEEKARREADEKARREAEQKARGEAEEKARREAEEKARRETEEKARRKAQEDEETRAAGARAQETSILERSRETVRVTPPPAPPSPPAIAGSIPASIPVPDPTPVTDGTMAPRSVTAAKFSPAALGGIAAVLLLLVGGGWYFTRDRAESESPAVPDSAPAAAAPESTARPPDSTAAANVPAAPAPTPPPPVPAAATPSAPAVPEAEINRIHTAFTAAMRRNNLAQAARVILDAPPAARTDKTIAADADRVLAATRQRASAALAQSQKTPAALASDDFRAAEAKRLEAANLERRGQLPEAAHEYLTAAAGYERALTAKPAPVTEAREVKSTPSAPPPTTATTPAVNPPPPVTTPTVAEAPPSPPAPSPAPPAARAPVDTTAADTAAIKETLAQFVAGYEKLDAATIKRVYPSAPANLTFNNVRSYSLTLDAPQISISGDRATVRTVRRLRVQMRAGAPQQQALPTEFTLRRAGNVWVVDSVK